MATGGAGQRLLGSPSPTNQHLCGRPLLALGGGVGGRGVPTHKGSRHLGGVHEEKALGRPVEGLEEQSVGVVRLPGGEVESAAGHEPGKEGPPTSQQRHGTKCERLQLPRPNHEPSDSWPDGLGPLRVMATRLQ